MLEHCQFIPGILPVLSTWWTNNRSASFLSNGRVAVEDGEMNFGFGFSWDMLINELLFDDKFAGEISPKALPEANPQVLNQSPINFQY